MYVVYYAKAGQPRRLLTGSLTIQQLPGLIHAWYIIARFPDDYDEYQGGVPREDGGESGRVTYVFVQPAPHQQPSARRQQQPNKPQPSHPQQPLQGSHVNYGTANANSAGPSTQNAGEGPSDGSANPPPTYAEAVKGDYKIQTQD